MNVISSQKATEYRRIRGLGFTRTAAAKKVGIAYNTAVKLDQGDPIGTAHRNGTTIRAERMVTEAGDPIAYEDLSEEAKKGWNDFAYFSRRYLGRIPIYWQVVAANQVIEAIESGDDEWLVINCPPGSGKSTIFTHDIPAWATVRNRALTGLLGSAVQNTAEKYIFRLKNTLARTTPLKADPRLIRLGLAVDAEATLAQDYGRFKPEKGIWAVDQFIVEQHEGLAVAEKEPTWSAFGRRGGVLGMRYQIVIWDDLVDPARLKAQELIDEDREWYADVAESRLEPGGTFVLQGQRLGPTDLYAFALGMKILPRELDAETEWDAVLEGDDLENKYKHIVFKAHYDEVCKSDHSLNSPAYGEGGCLLYPRRLGWRRLSSIMLNNLNRFKVVYQQEESDPETVLVQKEWINGTGGHPGCWDKERDRLQVPSGIDLKRCLSIVTIDPSPTKYWAIEWWLCDSESGFMWLIDLERKGMGADKWLDYNISRQEYTGLAVEMQQASKELGIPITHWIMETNAAQKFMTQYDMIHTFQVLHGIRIIPQDTYRNKSDANYGVQTIGRFWEAGKIRLPGKGIGRTVSLKLTDEVTTYPYSGTDDCVMAEWFLHWHLPTLYAQQRRRNERPVAPNRPPAWVAKEFDRTTLLAGVQPRKREDPSGARRIFGSLGKVEVGV